MTVEAEMSLTERVVAEIAAAPDPRFRAVMTSLVRHLHDFVRETQLTSSEWVTAINFLTATGQTCTAKRQEFILLSDTLGVSMLVDAINHPAPLGATESTVLGPFYVEGSPELSNCGDLAAGEVGVVTYVSGCVTDTAGNAIADATLDVWQTDDEGYYDVQRPERGEMRLRGKFRTDAAGRYWFRTRKPVSYPLPTDGPVGKMLEKMGRHPYRPAHIHFIVGAPGYETLTTHLFVAGDPYVESDAVFGVKPSLVVDFVEQGPGPTPDGGRSEHPFCHAEFNFGLKPS